MSAVLALGLLVPVASAHWGGVIPAHHTVDAPGGADVFDLPAVWCLPPGGARAQTHGGFNVDELNWHAVNIADGGTGTIAVDQFGAAVPVDPTGAEPAVTSLAPGHGHHGGDTPGVPIADHPALFDAVAGFELAVTPINPLAGTGVDGSSISSGDVDPGHAPACDAFHPSPLPQNPTGAGATSAFDTSMGVTPPAGLVFGCIDIGDNDFETGFGGGFFMIDAAPDDTGEGDTGIVNIVLGLLSTGPVDMFSCAVPAGFVSGAGTTPEVVYADALLPPNGAPYTVCYDGNDDGTCTTNVAATNDAWDQCQAEGAAQAVAAETIASPIWGSATTPTNLGPQYVTVAGGVSFFGVSIDGTDCEPKKAGALGVLTAAGPGNAATAAPSVAVLEAATGDPTIDFTYLVVFTSVCAEVTDPGDDCGLAGVNAGLATAGWLLAV